MRNHLFMSSLILGTAVLLMPGSFQAQSPTGPSTTPASTFKGPYAFFFKGETVAPPGTASGLAAAGAFVADGNGGTTVGTLDLNTAVGINLQAAPITGTYQLDATGRGTLVLTTSLGPLNFNFYVPPAKPGTAIAHAVLVPTGFFTGTGEVSQQEDFFSKAFHNPTDPFNPLDMPPFDTSIGFSEESTSGGGFLPGASLLEFTPPTSQMFVSGADSRLLGAAVRGYGQPIQGSPDPLTTATGIVTGTIGNPPAPNPPPGELYEAFAERLSITFSTPGQASTTPTHYAAYEGTDPSGFPVIYLLSLDSHASTDLVVGMIQQ